MGVGLDCIWLNALPKIIHREGTAFPKIKIRLHLAKRSPEKIIHREGTAFFQKNKKYDPRKFKATPVKNRPTRTTTAKPKAKPTALAPAPAPVFRISGAKTPAPAAVHISGR